jgi:hypothetical protein
MSRVEFEPTTPVFETVPVLGRAVAVIGQIILELAFRIICKHLLMYSQGLENMESSLF